MPEGIAITWLGHGSWALEGPGGVRVLVDPWTAGPTFPAALKDGLEADVIALTHGHGDHAGTAIAVAKQTGAPIVAPVEIAGALGGAGVENVTGFNKGGTVEVAGVRFTMTEALHTGSIEIDTGAAGYCEPAGFVITFANGTRVYAAGDTGIFSDMQLIGELYRPDAAILPIGDHYTMGPFQAAHACRLLGVTQVFPGHWGTFPLLTGRPAALREELGKLGLGDRVSVVDIEPGQTVS
jgi:L-ascorbate metabolism protein UlaG (beta-lactamase superfamily)